MGKIFDLNNSVMRGLGKITDLIVLNIIAIICCIPIFTIGASITALHSVSLRLVRNEEGYVIRDFLKAFKENFKQATLAWLIMVALGVMLAVDYLVIKNMGAAFSEIYKVIFTIIAILVGLVFVYVFPLLARFNNTMKQTFKNAFIISFMIFPKTILMILIQSLPVVLLIFYPKILPLVLLFLLSGPIYISALLYNKFFKKLEAQVKQPDITIEKKEDSVIC